MMVGCAPPCMKFPFCSFFSHSLSISHTHKCRTHSVVFFSGITVLSNRKSCALHTNWPCVAASVHSNMHGTKTRWKNNSAEFNFIELKSCTILLLFVGARDSLLPLPENNNKSYKMNLFSVVILCVPQLNMDNVCSLVIPPGSCKCDDRWSISSFAIQHLIFLCTQESVYRAYSNEIDH